MPGRELFQGAYYWLDLAIGFGAPLVVWGLYRRGMVDGLVWRLFWIGCLIGLTWEIPMFMLSAHDTGIPVLRWVRPLPLPYPVFMVSHTLWDGGLFLVGLWLVYKLCPAPHLERFRWRELAVLLVYGQMSELAVEVSSTFNEGWAFLPGYWWNPTLFTINDHPITLMPQLVWLAAPVVFYAAALWLRPPPGQLMHLDARGRIRPPAGR